MSKPAVLLCLIVGACQSGPSAENRMRIDQAPTPFSADEIRLGCPTGRSIKYLVKTADPETPDAHFTITFVETSELGARTQEGSVDLDGNRIGTVETRHSSWYELQRHGSFPASFTTITSAECTTPAGSFDCWFYTVASDDPAVDNRIERMWFAKSLPGPPVRLEIETGGEVVYEMALIENR